MSTFSFSNDVKILCGDHALDNLPFELRERDCTRPLFISDERSYRLGFVKEVRKAMDNDIIDFGATYFKVTERTCPKNCDDIITMYKAYGCDGIIALGGDNVIQCAKVAKLMLLQGVGDFVYFNHKTEMDAENAVYADLPLFILPTEIPSGIEATDRAYIFDEKNNFFYNFNSVLTRASAVILDVRLTDIMPAKVMATAGLGALAMGVKGFVDNAGNPMALAYATGAIHTVINELLPAMRHNSNSDYRISIYSSVINAGIAYYGTEESLLRDMTNELSIKTSLSPLQILSIIFPVYYKEKVNKDRVFKSVLMPIVGEEQYALSNAKSREIVAIDTLKEFWEKVVSLAEIPSKLREVGLEQSDFVKLADAVINRYKGTDPHNNFTTLVKLLEEAF